MVRPGAPGPEGGEGFDVLVGHVAEGDDVVMPRLLKHVTLTPFTREKAMELLPGHIQGFSDPEGVPDARTLRGHLYRTFFPLAVPPELPDAP